jgi:hypothetical protein
VLENLPNVCKALGLISSTVEKKKEEILKKRKKKLFRRPMRMLNV